MFNLAATRTRARDRRCGDAADAGACLAAAGAAARREVIVKHENHTPTGAFKVRGGLVYVDRLKRERPQTAGLISATTGNHGQSLAFAARRYGVPVTIYVPHGNSVEKNRAMQAFGADLVEHGEDFEAARDEAERHAERDGLEIRAVVPS